MRPGTIRTWVGLSDTYVGRHRKPSLFSVSRERKARLMDALAVLLLMLVMALVGMAVLIMSARPAKADPGTTYGHQMGQVICDNLGHFGATDAAIIGTANGITEMTGMTYADAGQAIYTAVSLTCPRYMPQLLAFSGRTVPHTPVAGVA